VGGREGETVKGTAIHPNGRKAAKASALNGIGSSRIKLLATGKRGIYSNI
jgi:hypothetical protein